MRADRTAPLIALLLVGPECIAGLAVTVAVGVWLDGMPTGWSLWLMLIMLGLAYVAAMLLAERSGWRLGSLAVLSVVAGGLIGTWFPRAELRAIATISAALALAAMLVAGWVGWRGPAIALRLRPALLVLFWAYLIGLPLVSVARNALMLRAVAVGGWVFTFGLTAGWLASLLDRNGHASGRDRLAAYLYALNLYLAAVIASGV